MKQRSEKRAREKNQMCCVRRSMALQVEMAVRGQKEEVVSSKRTNRRRPHDDSNTPMYISNKKKARTVDFKKGFRFGRKK